MTEINRRTVLRLGVGGAVAPLIAFRPLSLLAAQAADPEICALMRGFANQVLRLKRDLAGGTVDRPGHLNTVAERMRLLDAMAETRGWKSTLRLRRFPSVAEIDQAVPTISATLADRLTAAGLPTQASDVISLYQIYRSGMSEKISASLVDSIDNGAFIHAHANAFDAIADAMRKRPTNSFRLVSTGRKEQEEEVDICQALHAIAILCEETAIGFAFIPIPPFEEMAICFELIALTASLIAFSLCD